MITRPSVRASTEWPTPAGTIATTPSSGDLHKALDGHLKLPLDHFLDFFLGMEILVNG